VAGVGYAAEGALVVLCFKSKISFDHEHYFRILEHFDLADAVDVALDEGELLGGFWVHRNVRHAKGSRQGKCEKNADGPLTPLKMSMPMTCATDKMASESIPNVLEKAAHVLNRAWVAEMVGDSIGALEAEFFGESGKGPNAQIARLRGVVAGASHVEVLAVFYLLLNIEPGLKARVLATDAGNSRRIGRFLLDLRQELVVEFFCSGQSAGAFVQACNEAYCIS